MRSAAAGPVNIIASNVKQQYAAIGILFRPSWHPFADLRSRVMSHSFLVDKKEQLEDLRNQKRDILTLIKADLFMINLDKVLTYQ
jgi:hypothetical protein